MTNAASSLSKLASAATPAASPVVPAFDLHREIDALYSSALVWLHLHWLQIGIAVGAGAIAYIILNVARDWGLRACRKGHGGASWYAILGRALAKTTHFFMVLVAARLVVAYSSAPPPVANTVGTLFTIAAVFQGALWLREFVFGAIEHRTLGDVHRGQALVSALGIIRLLITIALFSIAVVLVLGNLGVNVTGLVAGLGVGGIAIGLAAQGIFADLFAALAILFDRPFSVGDSISYSGGAGTVEKIGLKSTWIRGAGGEQRIIANKKLLDSEILNTTRRLHNRFKFDFCLGYAITPEVVLRMPALLREAVESEDHVLVHGGVNGLAVNGLSYDVEFESKDTDFPADARDRMAAAILRRFRDQNISFAYPTQVNLVEEGTAPALPNLRNSAEHEAKDVT